MSPDRPSIADKIARLFRSAKLSAYSGVGPVNANVQVFPACVPAPPGPATFHVASGTATESATRSNGTLSSCTVSTRKSDCGTKSQSGTKYGSLNGPTTSSPFCPCQSWRPQLFGSVLAGTSNSSTTVTLSPAR